MKLILILLLSFLVFETKSQTLPAEAQYSGTASNLLTNPSFEQGKKGWVNSAGTFSITTVGSEISDLKSAAKVVLSSQALTLSQSITPPSGSQAQAVVGILYKVPSGFTDFRVCSLINGAEKDCVPTTNLILDNLYHSIEIPTVLVSGQSVGIKVKTTANATGTVFFDAAYVKQGIGLTPVTLVETDSLTSNNASNGSLTDVTAEVQFSSVTASSANVISVVQDGANTRTKFIALKDCVVNVSYNTSSAISEYGVIYKNGVEIARGSTSYVSTRNLMSAASVSLLAGEYVTVGLSTGGASTAAAYTFTMTAQSIQKSSLYSGTNGNFAHKNVGTITIGSVSGGSPTKGTIATDQIIASRYGDRLVARYQYKQTTSGATATASGDMLFSLPIVDGVQLTFHSDVKVFTGTMFTSNMDMSQSIVGTGMATSSAFVNNCTLFAYSTTKFRAFCLNVGSNGGATNGYTIDQTNFSLTASVNQSYGFNLDAPMNEWTNSNTIIGSFATLGIKTSTPASTTSGTSIDFTGIPAGVKRITLTITGLSTNGTSNLQFQLGTSGGVQSTGYLGSGSFVGGSVGGVTYTTGLGIVWDTATDSLHGKLVFELLDSSVGGWVGTLQTSFSTRAFNQVSTTYKSLTGVLDRIRITTVNGTDTFDAGSANISWEF